MMAAIQAAIGSSTVVTDIESGLVGLKTAMEVNAKAIELQAAVVAVQSNLMVAQTQSLSSSRRIEALNLN